MLQVVVITSRIMQHLTAALQHCSTACFSPVRVRLLVGQAPGGHRAEAGARPRLGVVRVQAGVQRQVRHLLI